MDDELLQRIRLRDTDALAELYDRHAAVLFGILRRMLREHGAAEDTLQEVFIRVWQRADSYDPTFGSARAWLVRIARNRAIDYLRNRQARGGDGETSADTLEVASAEVPPDQCAMARQTRSVLCQALVALDREQRVLIEHTLLFGSTQSELAAHFQLPIGTVKTRMRRGLQTLRLRLRHVHAS